MTVKRLALAGVAGVTALAMSACSSAVTEADPETSSAPPARASSTQTTTEEPTPSATVDVPSGVVGSGCEDYIRKIPSGPGSLVGMAIDPVTLAMSNSQQLTTFAGAVVGNLNPEVDLGETLNKGQYTIFAPTDDAFGRLAPEEIEKLTTEAGQLTSVLNYHVVSGELAPSSVDGEHKTLQGQTLNVSGAGDNLRVNGAGVVCGGIKTANAILYLIDTVLLPPTAPTTKAPSESGSDSESGTSSDSSGTDSTDTSTTSTTPTS